jgi:hypothetical protein
MAWRKQENHREETKAVRDALARAGINAKVGHGTGTAWGWLEINIGTNPFAHSSEEYSHNRQECPACLWSDQTRSQVLKLAKEVTGRSGQYDGDILVLSQGGVLNG